MAALRLALEGVKVLMIEAGRNYDPTTETAMFNTPEMAPLRGERTPQRPFGHYDCNVGGWQVAGEPYTNKRGLRATSGGGGGANAGRDAPITGVASR